MKTSDKSVIRALKGETCTAPPIWLMRQAGRYLPEYRAVRAEVGGFMALCFDPARACEVTLQPIRRYGFDAAILFSDILVIPHALGQTVSFVEGEGPKLEPLNGAEGVLGLSANGLLERLSPVLETVDRLTTALPPETTLIGFSGAPWTVATYMIEGGSSRDFAASKRMMFTDPEGFQRLIDIVTDATIDYLSAQASAGAEVLQVFDSWAGVLDESSFQNVAVQPMKRIVSTLKERHPETLIIGFPKGCGALFESYVETTGVDGISIDPGVPRAWAAAQLQSRVCVQGNLEPLRLLAGGAGMISEARAVLNAFGQGPFIFNLGHGIHKDTDPDTVAKLVETVRAWRA